ncbi:MAG: hypothetical protein GVY32_11985 [Gammaproteobacteria bacterium]|jgi:hypothetical protein|nr:hypothetical protein [Gammaproteobacteria bacterium]
MGSRSAARNNRIRQEIAAEAARIIATEGQRSYLAAKEKAARRVGASTRTNLPSNAEVEQALREWQHLYGGAEHEHTLFELREAAASAMRFLAEFRPRLVGPVLEGTADEHSRISLHVFADDPDAVVHFLMERHVPFSQETRRIRWHDGSGRDLEIIVIEGGGHAVELIQMIGPDARQAPPSPIDGRTQRRAGLTEVERLAADSAPVHDDQLEW